MQVHLSTFVFVRMFVVLVPQEIWHRRTDGAHEPAGEAKIAHLDNEQENLASDILPLLLRRKCSGGGCDESK